jgi:predicted membrane protein
MAMNKSGGIWLGILLIAVGALLLLDNMYVVDFSEIFHTYWPVLLIIWGLNILGRRSSAPSTQEPSSGRVDGATATVYPSSEAQYLSSSTVFGDYTVAIQSKSFAGGIVSTTFGNTDIDFLNARLAEGEHSLKLDGVFGNTTLHLPKEMAFVVFANTTFGNILINDQRKEGISSSLDYASPNFHTAKERLRISASRVFGSIRVIA